MTEPQAKLVIGDQTFEFPILSGTVGPQVIDIRSLYAKTGLFTYDPGFTSTAACDSSITYIDGDKGELMYRGYPIEQLADKSNYLEVCYLLLYGELPSPAQMTDFQERVTRHTMLHEQVHLFFRGFRRDAHPMAIVCGVVGALAAFYSDSADINDPMQREIASIRMIAKLPTIVAMAYKYSVGQPFVYPRNDLSYSSNFLRMCFSVPAEEYEVNPVVARAMDLIFTLHADHEQNASTSTVRLAGSSDANPFACIAAGVACLWGPAHGGANEAALNMLREIGTVDRIPEFIERAKDRNSGSRLMGFGHRVYKNGDSRVPTMKEALIRVATARNGQRWLDIYNILEKEMFAATGIKPNLDFPTGPAYYLMGFDIPSFTPLFVMSRITGWTAHIIEQAGSNALIRPLSEYSGQPQRSLTAARAGR